MFCAPGWRLPDSTSRTISTTAADTGVGTLCSRPLRHHVAVHVVDLGRPLLDHVLGHRRAPVASARGRRREHAVERLPGLAPSGVRPLLDRGPAELRHADPWASPTRADSAPRWIVMARPTSLDAISDEPSPDMPCTGLPIAFWQSLDQRSPQRLSVACAPSITESISASSVTRGVMRPSCSPGAEDVVALARAALHPALDLSGLPHRHADLRHDEAHRAIGAGHGGHARIGPAVLRRDHVAARRQVTQPELGGPLRVVHLHGHEGDVEVAGQLLRLVQVHRLRAGHERVVRARHGDAARVDGVHLLGPGVDQRHVVAGAREERSEVAADGAGADEEKLLAHVILPLRDPRR